MTRSEVDSRWRGIVNLCFRPHVPACILVAALLACLPAATANPSRDKSVWNYDGGILLITDGSISDGPCFRISGRVTAPQFFDNLKRIDRDDSGAIFRRGTETLTRFPDQLILAFVVYDHPCSTLLEHTAARTYLTRSLMSSLHLYLYWKRGVELRPIANVEPKYFSVDPILTHSVGRASDLPEKLEWSYEFAVPSTGVPLTDSLVLVLRAPDGRIAARVAARM
jgi:hypothetical protein